MNYLANKPFISSGERKKSRENGRASGEARVIFRVWLSSDFSRLSQMERLLAGYLCVDVND